MRKIQYTEPYDKYLLDNHQEQSLAKMCEHLGITVKVGGRILKKLGVVRDKKLWSKFMGHKTRNDEWDNYFRDNYLLRPLTHMCKHIGVSTNCGERMMKRLCLVRPPELIMKFKSRNLNCTNTKKKTTLQKKLKAKIKKEKSKTTLTVKKEKVEKTVAILPTKVVDYSTKVMVKIDNRTWVYRDKTA